MNRSFLLLAVGLLAGITQPALASDRYGNRPPVIVNSDLTAPWVNQLGGGVRPKVYAPPRRVQPQPQARFQQQPAPQYQQRQTYQRRQLAAPPPGVHIGRNTGRQQVIQQAAVRPNAPVGGVEPQFLPQMVSYRTPEKPGTIVIDTNNRFLYLVMDGGQAKRYGVGVGKPGFEWAGVHKVTRKAEWPTWHPPAEMRAREAKKGHVLPVKMEGGPANPLGARALYLGSTLYRIHGTNAPWTIGNAVSSGCIRMRNEDVIDLYQRVGVGTRVIVQ
ncbi:L,D-transpeptidase [Rhizobiaceae bacterium BDR2-2]|uniref:L,D-transpeptidase n=1 Tax=Ectorhizobium quercum TaxID=2965071 RepID=A0AAE3N2E6_9HYPH|nr:L,D-transpeptidase [Ectorhizobium quercum]MCX8996279.1 L,D-transpeptidase [Ectorhizobium quercum]MCX8998682.1 L,D-transpeptidase [Ectorhizobium quercum]